jgi:hypothetical protein
MSPPIRPLPIDASQRTENGAAAATASKGENTAGFDALLGRQVESKEREKDKPSKTEPAKSNTQPSNDPSPWAVFGADLGKFVLQAMPDPTALPAAMPRETSTEPVCAGEQEIGSFAGAPSSKNRPGELQHKAKGRDQPFHSVRPDNDLALLPEAKEQDLPPPPSAKMAVFAVHSPEPEQKADGTPAAKQDSMLLMPEKSADLSSKEQVSDFTAATSFEPEKDGLPRPASFDTNAFDGAFHFEPRVEIAAPKEISNTVETRPLDVVKSIEQQVHVLRSAGQKELEVVIRPDANTEIYLHLRNHDGQVQLHARCEKGDFHWLESQWNTVQSSLGAQGVRVEPLEAAFRAQNNPSSGGSFAQQDGGERNPQRENEFFFEQEFPQRLTTKQALHASALQGRGWQSWA